ncbi:MAG: hypothetical protein PHW69_08990, partial [Elusimicrobiaceae bacterium]|nr:hypothetical protein [Elusimicrobiaceae bacterium]
MAQKRKTERHSAPAARAQLDKPGSAKKSGGGFWRRILIVSVFFVAPLLFFTGLTRNPYYTQIVLLNTAMLVLALFKTAALWRDGPITFRYSPPDIPWAGWIFACVLSWVVSYSGHAAFFRPAIAGEGLRAFLFLLVNAFGAYLLGKSAEPEADSKPSGWLLVFVLWALLWGMYPGLKQTAVGPGILANIFDPYGTILWVG